MIPERIWFTLDSHDHGRYSCTGKIQPSCKTVQHNGHFAELYNTSTITTEISTFSVTSCLVLRLESKANRGIEQIHCHHINCGTAQKSA